MNRSIDEKNDFLTSAAKEVLEDILVEYKSRILDEAFLRAIISPKGEKEISVRDIIDSVENLNQKERQTKKRKIELVMQIYSILGIIFVLASLTILLEGSFDPFNTRQLVMITGFVTGITFIFMPLIYQRLRGLIAIVEPTTASKQTAIDASYAFIQRWKLIEETLRKLSGESGLGSSRRPFSSIIQELQFRGQLSKSDGNRLRELLSMRNAIVHEEYRVGRDEIRFAINNADDLLIQIQKLKESQSKGIE